MPAELGSSVVNPAALSRPTPQQSQQGQRSREEATQGTETNPQAVRAAGTDTVVPAPEPTTGGQEAQNRQDAGSGSASGSDSQPRQNEAGVGGNVDISI